MEHEKWLDQIPFYIAQTLPSAERAVFDQHLTTCSTCQAELKQWTQIAAAVWSEAEDAARRLPPLSQEVYNRLQYRDRPPANRYAANPPRPAYARTAAIPPRPIKRAKGKGRNYFVPVTMVAGLIMAVLFGGLLMFFALMNLPVDLTQQGADVAIGITREGFLTQESFAGIIQQTETPRPFPTSTLTNTLAPAILPPRVTTIAPTPESIEQTNPEMTGDELNQIGMGGGNDSMQSLALASSMADEGPFVTLTPELYADGYHLCTLFNPLDHALPVYGRADFDAARIGEVQPNEEYRTLIRSANGWYQIFIPSPNGIENQPAWMPPTTAYLKGNCYGAEFWLPTTTPQSPPNGDSSHFTPIEGMQAVVQNPFADLYSEASFDNAVAVAQAGDKFPVLGVTGERPNRFFQVQYSDGRLLWLWENVIGLEGE